MMNHRTLIIEKRLCQLVELGRVADEQRGPEVEDR